MTTVSSTPTSSTVPLGSDESTKKPTTTPGSVTAATAAAVASTYPSYMIPSTTTPHSAPVIPTAPFGSSASLYVGELHPDVTESMLFELFNQVGPVTSIRVCRDAITRRSLGYAYVNFNNVLDAERALDTLNYTLIKGQACRIMWSQRDPSLRRSGTGNIFIKNLDKSIDNKALHDTFSAFGNILSCKVVADESGSKGYGFVHFETKEAAEQAIAKVNGMLLNDKKVYVGHHVSRKERVSKIEELKARFTNVYVKNLDESITDEEFVKMFESFGEISSAVIQRDSDSKSKGFGFVNYIDHESALKAVEAMNNKELNGKVLTACRAQLKSEREEELKRAHEAARQERLAKYQGVNLYVKNLDASIDEERLKKEFSTYGEIASCKIMIDEKNVSRGFGFVCFVNTDDSNKAVQEMNGKMLDGKPVYVALAQRKEERRSMLEAQYAQRSQYRFMTMGNVPGMPPNPAMYYATGMHPNMYMMGGARMPGAYPPNANPAMVGGRLPPRWMMMQHNAPGYGPRIAPMQGSIPQTPGSPGPAQLDSNGQARPPQGVMQPGLVRGSNVSGTMNRRGPMMMGANNSGYYMMPGGPGSMPGRPGGNVLIPPGASSNVPMMARRGMPPGGYRGPGMRGQNMMMRDGNNPEWNMAMGNTATSGPAAGLTAAALAAAPPEVQKQMLGERIYPVVYTREPEHAPKITGMLLEMDNGELLHLLESPQQLSEKITEAATVLKQHSSPSVTVEPTA